MIEQQLRAQPRERGKIGGAKVTERVKLLFVHVCFDDSRLAGPRSMTRQ
jgi:hypothetical protein